MFPAQPSMPGWSLRPDIFHNWHLGAARYFVASSLVVLQKFDCLFPGGGVEARFSSMTSEWLQYCKNKKDTWLISYFAAIGFIWLLFCPDGVFYLFVF